MKQRLLLVIIFWGWVGCPFFNHNTLICCSQTLDDIFPSHSSNSPDFTLVPIFLLINDRSILGLSEEQQLFAQKWFSDKAQQIQNATRLQAMLEENYEGPTVKEIQRQQFSEFIELLGQNQVKKLNDFVLTMFIDMENQRAFSRLSDNMLPLQSMVFSPSLARFLDISDNQRAQLQIVKREAQKKKTEYLKSKPGGFETDVFAQWQQALYELLLPLQQSRYNEALGEEAPFLKSMLKDRPFRKFYLDDRPISEADPNSVFEQWTVISDPKLDSLLQMTHPHLDARMHPHGLLDFLWEDRVVDALKLRSAQQEKLGKVRDDWFAAHARPNEMKISAEFGRSMTTRAMREAAAKMKEEYGSYYDQIDSILTDAQNERLRQLGNQILMYRGWQEVPLTCPEWRDYLELTGPQQADFHRVQERFRLMLKRLEWERLEYHRNISVELEEKIGQILTDKQERTVLLMYNKREL